MTRPVAYILGILAVLTPSAWAGDCEPGPHLASWDQLRTKYRGTSGEADVERLWQVRQRTCNALAAGELTPAEARRAFEQERQELIEKWGRETGSPADTEAG